MKKILKNGILRGMAKNKLNKTGLHDHINDPYVKLAQKEGYRAACSL